jgi:RNA polymerase primary sigma factor
MSQWWLNTIGRVPLLTPAEEIELGTAIQRWLNHPEPCPPGIRRRGQRARERFITANLRLAVSYVQKRCQRLARAYDTDELIQAANEGVIKAVERFDPTRGYRFSTYAYWWIRQSVNAWCDRHGRIVAIPGSHSQHLSRLGPVVQRLELELNRTPTREEIAAELGVSMAVFEQLAINARPVASLDLIVSDDGLELGETIACHDPSLEDLEERAERLRQAEQLRGLVNRLPPADRQLVSLAYQLDGEERTPQDVARAVGWSVRRVEARLRLLEQQLRGMALQLVLVAIPTTRSANTIRPCWKRRRRLTVVDGQLCLPIRLLSAG